jgi:hypothetical protein
VHFSNADSLLLSFLGASESAEEDALLARLITEHVGPIVRRTINYKLRSYDAPAKWNPQLPDLDEVSSDIQAHLLGHLREMKNGAPGGRKIEDFEGYVTVVARNACDDYLRRKAPLRRSLKDRIRYHLLRRPQFALWEGAKDVWLAGFNAWADKRSPPPTAASSRQGGDARDILYTKLRNVDVYRLKLDSLLHSIFQALDRPVELNFLIEIVSELWGISDSPPDSLHDERGLERDWPAGAPADLDTAIEHRQLLDHLWHEVRQLPRRQRAALLLNLRNPNGVNVITLFPATGVATVEQIAEALEMTCEEFEKLWGALPMDDLSIAEYLGATRQQVINLRKNAREKLMRRIQAFNR